VTVKLPNVPNTVEFTCVVIAGLCYSVFTLSAYCIVIVPATVSFRHVAILSPCYIRCNI